MELNQIGLEITESEINDCYAPSVMKELRPNDGEWDAAIQQLSQKIISDLIRKYIFWWRRRTQKNIEISYSEQWKISFEDQLESKKPTLSTWGDRCFFASTYGTKRVHLLHLYKILSILKPEKVLEVGAGNGLNLFIMNALLPEIKFHGSELTTGGVEAANNVIQQPGLPAAIIKFSPVEIKDPNSKKDIQFDQRNAKSTGYDDNEFDVVFTILALEQMQEIRDSVLHEMNRISKEYVIMIEPFNDYNKSSIRKNWKKSQNYFSLKVSQLEKYGLRPVYVTGNFPSKVSLGIGIVVAKKIK